MNVLFVVACVLLYKILYFCKKKKVNSIRNSTGIMQKKITGIFIK